MVLLGPLEEIHTGFLIPAVLKLVSDCMGCKSVTLLGCAARPTVQSLKGPVILRTLFGMSWGV